VIVSAATDDLGTTGESTDGFAGRAGVDEVATSASGTTRWQRLREWLRTPRGIDVTVVSTFVLGALYVVGRLWIDPTHRLQSSNLQDHMFFEWVLGHAQWSVTNLTNPLFSDRLNVPDGVNMMANTSVLALAIPLVPVTALFGPGISYAVLLTLGFAATATAWYWLLSRHVVTSRVAAFIGGGFCAFAPGMVSQGNGHPNLVSQFVIPLIIWRVLVLFRPGVRPVRDGAILGLLVTLQAFINEELLFFTAIACAVFLIAYAAPRWRSVKATIPTAAKGLAATAAVAGSLLAYPLWFQFFGPQHYRGVPIYTYRFRTDLASFWSFATESVAGGGAGFSPLAVHPAEENTFYGWPLVLFLAAGLWIVRRRPVAVATAAAGIFFTLLTLGHTIILGGRVTGIPGPWRIFEKLPLFDSVVPARLALAVIPAVGVLLALIVNEVLVTAHRLDFAALPIRPLLFIALLGALLPIAPTPLRAETIEPTPAFISAGMWREYVTTDRTMVTVPPSSNLEIEGQRWSAEQGLEIALGQGYALFPGGPDGRATYPAPPTPTSELLDEVAEHGYLPFISERDIEAAHEDLIRWRAAIVVLGPHPNEESLKTTVEALLGPAQNVGGVWLWDVRNAPWQPEQGR
jgi:hypothetical protein